MPIANSVDRPTDVVAVAELDLTGVQCGADVHGFRQCPRLVTDRFLQVDSGGCGRRPPIEDRGRRIALAAAPQLVRMSAPRRSVNQKSAADSDAARNSIHTELSTIIYLGRRG
jgi:hypothetical protein